MTGRMPMVFIDASSANNQLGQLYGQPNPQRRGRDHPPLITPWRIRANRAVPLMITEIVLQLRRLRKIRRP